MNHEAEFFLELLAWCFLGLSFVIAAVGTLLPGIPGAFFVVIAAIFHKLLMPNVFSWTLIFILGFLALLSWLMDFVGTVIGAKVGGSSKAGLIGASIGSLAFFIIGFPGLILGPFFGAIIGDIYARRSNYVQLLRSGLGASLGFFITIFIRFMILLTMAVLVSFGMIIA